MEETYVVSQYAGNDRIPLLLFGGVHNFHFQGVILNHSARQRLTPFLPHQSFDLGLCSCDCTTFESTTNRPTFSYLLWKLFAPFCTNPAHQDMLFWEVFREWTDCSCHTGVNVRTRPFRVFPLVSLEKLGGCNVWA